MDNLKVKALANFLNIEAEEVKQGYNDNTFEANNEEYIVLTDEEADKEVETYINDSVWAFNASFILEHSNISWNSKIEESLKKIQSELCEDANELLKAIITDFDEFVQDAINSDGRGHFLAGYDGEENQEEDYYIYRTN